MKKTELLEMIQKLQLQVAALDAKVALLSASVSSYGQPTIFGPSGKPPRCLACGCYHGVWLPCPYTLTTAIAGSPPNQYENKE